MVLKELLSCCCCSTEEPDGLNINVTCTNACCQKTTTIREESQRNIFRRAASSFIRRRQEVSRSSPKETKGDSIVSKPTMDISVSQTNSI